MRVLFVSFVDKFDRPLLVHSIGSPATEKEIRYNVLSNLALDYFEDLSNDDEVVSPTYLYQMDETVVYGEYLRHKGLRILVGLSLRNDEYARSIFQKVRLYYLQSVINPFQENWTDRIKSKLETIDSS